MLEDAFAAFEREVESLEFGVALLELVDHAQGLQVVLEAAVRAHAIVERVLARVAERRMSEVVREGDGLRQRLVQAQGAAPSERAICATSIEWVIRVR